jgi:glutamate dehydrogenase/leucine dehydrogenase
MLEYAKTHKSIDGFPGGEALSNEQLFGLDVDVLIPAALENQVTMDNAPSIKAKILVEGANGPTTPDAHQHLHQRGVFVIPDILANAGGVTTLVLRVGAGPLRLLLGAGEVNTRLEQKMVEAFDDVLQTSMKYKVDLRTAAYIVAISRGRQRHPHARHVRVGCPPSADAIASTSLALPLAPAASI